jgi:hypothetical protein
MASTTLTLACTASSSLASMLLLVRTTGCWLVIMEILTAVLCGAQDAFHATRGGLPAH